MRKTWPSTQGNRKRGWTSTHERIHCWTTCPKRPALKYLPLHRISCDGTSRRYTQKRRIGQRTWRHIWPRPTKARFLLSDKHRRYKGIGASSGQPSSPRCQEDSQCLLSLPSACPTRSDPTVYQIDGPCEPFTTVCAADKLLRDYNRSSCSATMVSSFSAIVVGGLIRIRLVP